MNDKTGTAAPAGRVSLVSPSGVDVMEAIYERRAVRAYRDRKVEAHLLRALIDAAIQAPSAVNQQPWAFAVVEDAGVLRRISERAKKLSLAHIQPGTALADQRSRLEDPAFDVFYDARTLIVVCAGPGVMHVSEDCCLAAQNLMLAAHGLGLGTCPVGLARDALNEPDLKGELGIPPDHAAVFPIIVGYPREHPARTPRRAARILGRS